VTFTLLLMVLVVLAAYYFLGAPLLDFIHNFTKEFTRTFPLWSVFLPVTAARATRPRPRRSPAHRHPSPAPRPSHRR
jgi:hypothetical protein